jgi:serine/threonine protein kinase
VTHDIPADLIERVSEVYERGPKTPQQLRDILLDEKDREIILTWPAKEGKYGRVNKARHTETGEISAIKTLKKVSASDDSETLSALFMREIEAMKRMVHPAILGLIGFIPPPKAPPSGQSHGDLHFGKIVTEFMPNDTLANLIASSGYAGRSATLKVKIAVGIAAAMRYMHAGGIVHRDLKPLNILLDDRWEPRLADFGSARAGNWELAFTLTAEVGTVLYAAPETFGGDPGGVSPDYGPSVDVYSYGITLWEIITGIPMAVQFKGYTPYTFQTKVKESHLRPPVPPDEKEGRKAIIIIPWVAELLSQCWDHDPSVRPSFEKILHDFRANRFELLQETIAGQLDAGQVDAYLSGIEEYEREHPPQRAG